MEKNFKIVLAVPRVPTHALLKHEQSNTTVTQIKSNSHNTTFSTRSSI